MKNILVPTDFSNTAKMAQDFALKMARKSNAKVTLLHALDFPIPMGDMYVSPTIANEVYEASTASVSRELQRICKHYKEEGLDMEYFVQLGPLTEVIEGYANDHEFDMVIMGTHGASGLKEAFVGSNTEKVIRKTLEPVFTIHDKHELTDINKILVPTAPEDMSEGFISELKDLAEFFEAKLYFLYVNTPGGHVNDKFYHEEMDNLLKSHNIKNYEIHTERDFNPEDGIFRFAESTDANMICITTHGKLGLGHMFNGSLAEDIANHAHIPVWTYNLRADKEKKTRIRKSLAEA